MLGGISQTICAFESLASRGFEVGCLVLLSGGEHATEQGTAHAEDLGNAATLRARFGNLPVFELPLPPVREESDASADDAEGHDLAEWMDDTREAFDRILDEIQKVHQVRESTGQPPELLATPRTRDGAVGCPYADEKLLSSRPSAEAEHAEEAHETSKMLAADMRLLWHPYTSTTKPMPCLPVKSASGVRLKLADGNELIDGMSSWWSTIHGCECEPGRTERTPFALQARVPKCACNCS